MTKALTKRQAGVYVYIYDYVQENHYPPTVREIADAFDIKSTNGVVEHLKALARKGFIEKDGFKSRAIRPLVPREEGLKILEGREENAPASKPRRQAPARHTEPQTASHKKLRILGRIACGAPIFAEENFDEDIDVDPALFCRGEDNTYALRVRGTSMIGDGIMPGDLVIVRPQQTAEDGEMIAAMLDGCATVKRYEKRKGIVHLIPSNPDMDPIIIRPEDNVDFQILGSIRGVMRFYK
ncbi:MAG: transcriptional repressor LexA [Proteobacteria bacterium]|nr:transcriptional repressor LexA [Pseudomonadota bacterium]